MTISRRGLFGVLLGAVTAARWPAGTWVRRRGYTLIPFEMNSTETILFTVDDKLLQFYSAVADAACLSHRARCTEAIERAIALSLHAGGGADA